MASHRVLACALMTALMAARASAQTPRDPMDSGMSKRDSRCGSRSRAPPPASPAPAAKTSSRTLTMRPANVYRPSWRRAGRVPMRSSVHCSSSMPRGAPECRNSAKVLAFAQAGASAILVCGDRFKRAFQRNPKWTEIVVIHEFLHALGLGENPPKQPGDHGTGPYADAVTDTRILSRPNASIGPAKPDTTSQDARTQSAA